MPDNTRSGRSRAGDLQGADRSPWRAHPGGERRRGAGHRGHLHTAGGRAGEGAAAGLVPAGRPAPRGGPEQTPILVVDDDPKTLRYVRDALAGSEYAPLVTGDPKEVSGLIRSERPRLVLLD